MSSPRAAVQAQQVILTPRFSSSILRVRNPPFHVFCLRVLQEPYVRTRENPFFNGLLRGDVGSSSRGLSSERPKSAEGRDLSRSRSDIRDSRRTKFGWGVPELTKDSTGEDSNSDFAFDPLQRSSSESWSKNPKPDPFSFPTTQSDVDFDMPDSTAEEVEKQQIEVPLVVIPRPSTPRTFTVKWTKPYMAEVPLPMCAASFYNGESPVVEIVESCESMKRLNSYLKERRDDVSAGIPGKFLHVVMGQDVLGRSFFANLFS